MATNGVQDINASITAVLGHLNAVSSQYKYVVTATTVYRGVDAGGDANGGENSVATSLGSLWDTDTDGYITLPIVADARTTVVFTIVFIKA